MSSSPRRSGAAVPLAAVLAAVLALPSAACGNRGMGLIPPPKQASGTTSTTGQQDLSSVGLTAVSGRTTTTVAVQGGQATLNGSVQGPDGPVAGAVVHAERLVGDGVGSAELTTQADGSWQLPGVRGGRYRVRAWRPPDLSLVNPQIFLLGSAESKSLTLRLDRYNGPAVTSSIAPNPPIVDSPANLVVMLGTRSVDDRGVVRTAPITATVQLTGPGAWVVHTPNPTNTTGPGRASWDLTCQQGGSNPLGIIVSGTAVDGSPVTGSFPLDVAACMIAPPPTAPPTTATTAPATTVPATTTTTRPRTTTTR
jgi:hypothetical protein